MRACLLLFKNKFSTFISLIIFVCIIFTTDNGVVCENNYSKWLFFCGGAFFLLFLIHFSKFYISDIYILITATTFIWLVKLLIEQSMGCFFTSFSFLIYYTLFYFNKSQTRRADIVPVSSFIFIGLMLSISAIIQYTNGFTLISGTYDNPAGLTLTLALITPFVISILKTTQCRVVKVLLVACIIINGLTIYISASRTGMIAYLFVIAYPFWGKYKKVLFVSLIVTFLSLTFCYKSQSSLGRLFIYKTTLTMIEPTTVLLGKGSGAFEKEYMQYQAKQFIKGNNNEKYELLAGNTLHPLNEFLLLLVEHGILFLLLLLFIIIYLFKCKWEGTAAFSSFVVIIIFSLFSYPFKYPITLFILAYSLTFLKDFPIYKFRVSVLLQYVLMGIISLYGINTLAINIHDNKLWKKSFNQTELGKYEEAEEGYKEIYPRMNHNFYFMYNYAATRYNAKDYVKCLQLLEQTSLLSNNYDIQLLTAQTYEKLEQDSLAFAYYQKAIQMCPNRFIPLYGIFKIYNRRGDVINRNQIGSKILHKPIKVNSYTVQEIQKSVYDIMNKQK